jgi:hypothetical protein
MIPCAHDPDCDAMPPERTFALVYVFSYTRYSYVTPRVPPKQLWPAGAESAFSLTNYLGLCAFCRRRRDELKSKKRLRISNPTILCNYLAEVHCGYLIVVPDCLTTSSKPHTHRTPYRRSRPTRFRP